MGITLLILFFVNEFSLAATESDDATCASVGSHVSIQFTGRILHTTSSSVHREYDSGTLEFTVGAAEVIAGIDEGVVGLCVGRKAKFVVPPAKGYGSTGVEAHHRDTKWFEGVPSHATLEIEMEMLKVFSAKPPLGDVHGDMFGALDADKVLCSRAVTRALCIRSVANSVDPMIRGPGWLLLRASTHLISGALSVSHIAQPTQSPSAVSPPIAVSRTGR